MPTIQIPGFLMEYFGSPIYDISSANKDNLTTYFPVCNPLISFFYIISLDGPAPHRRPGPSGVLEEEQAQ